MTALVLATEQGLVESVEWRQVLYVGDALVHGPGEVVAMVQAAQDDAGEVDGLHKDAEQGPLDAYHVPAAGETHRSEGENGSQGPVAWLVRLPDRDCRGDKHTADLGPEMVKKKTQS